jgi:hypothetical protein
VSESLSIAVELIYTNRTPPAILPATVTWFDGMRYKVTLGEGVDAPAMGDRLILDFGQNESPRVLAAVTELDGAAVTLSIRRSQPRDKREFPRMQGGIQLRYTTLSPPDAAAEAAWADRGEAPEGAQWRVPDPFMDFSASGLKFDDAPVCADGDRLLMELEVPTAEGRWRGVARVVRVSPIPEDEREEGADAESTHYIAVEFTQLPAEAIEALMHFTLHLQGSLL